MKLPNQPMPIVRNKVGLFRKQDGIHPSFWCGVCKGAVGGVINLLVGLSCTEALVGFEGACNLALDVEFPGAGEAICVAAGAALEATCEAEGGIVTKSMAKSVARTACKPICD